MWIIRQKDYKSPCVLIHKMENQLLTKEILEELYEIKKELNFIREHMVDVDFILTSEEEERLEQSILEYKNKKTISFDKLKKQIGV